MAIPVMPGMNAEVENISALGDNPNTDNNLSADALKAEFDLAGKNIKTYLNNTLIPQLNAALAAIDPAQIPNGTITAAKLSNILPNDIGIVIGTETPTDETPIISAGQIYLKYTPAAED